MTLLNTVKAVLSAGEKLKGPSANEANTKALLIEPLLSALGWDVTNPEEVVREWRVYDGTLLDYALRVDDDPALFLEAKGVGKKLDDPQFIAQTVNYANNEGVRWCVLTNGLTYRVYRPNEPVPMTQKLLFEVDLKEVAAESGAEATSSLQLLRRESVIDGSLDLWGERVFTDTRVRKALATLAMDATPVFVNEIAKAMGKPEVPPDRLNESLARVFDAQVGAAGEGIVSPPKPAKSAPPANGKQEYPLAHHLDGKPASIVNLFELVDEYGRSLGADVTRRTRKHYVGYFRGKRSFFTVETQRQRVLVYLALDPQTAKPWNQDSMRDVADIGHFGMGNTEYSLRSSSQIDEVRQLIKAAYEAVS